MQRRYSAGSKLLVLIVSSAVLFQFSDIGESITQIDVDLLNKFEYPWHKVRSFRSYSNPASLSSSYPD